MAIVVKTVSDSKDAQADLAKLRQSVEGIKSSVAGATDGLQKAAIGIGAAIAAASAAMNFAKLSDGLTNLETRLRLVTKTNGQFEYALDSVRRVANRTRQDLGTVAGLYQKLSQAGNEFGISQARVAKTTEIVAKAVAQSGQGAAQAKAAIDQLGQALGSGKLNGDELKSILENANPLAKAIATGLGVSIGKLRELGEAGMLTTTKVFAAIEKSQDEVASNFEKVKVTYEAAFTNLGNSLQVLAHEASRALLGSSGGVAKFIDNVANSLFTFAVNLRVNLLKAKADMVLFVLDGMELFGEFSGKLAEFATAAGETATTLYNEWKPVFEQLSQEIVAFTLTATATVSAFARDLYNKILGSAFVADVRAGAAKIIAYIKSSLRAGIEYLNAHMPTIDVMRIFPSLEKALDLIKSWAIRAERWFFYLYDKVIGHSWIPDLVTETADWLKKLTGSPLRFILDFVQKGNAAFGSLKMAVGLTAGLAVLYKYKSVLSKVAILAGVVGGAFAAISFARGKSLSDVRSDVSGAAEKAQDMVGGAKGQATKYQKKASESLETVKDYLKESVENGKDAIAQLREPGLKEKSTNALSNLGAGVVQSFKNFFSKPAMTQEDKDKAQEAIPSGRGKWLLPIIAAVTGAISLGVLGAFQGGPVRMAILSVVTTAAAIFAGKWVRKEEIIEAVSGAAFAFLDILRKGLTSLVGGNVLGSPIAVLSGLAKIALLFSAGREAISNAIVGAIKAPTKFAESIVSKYEAKALDKDATKTGNILKTLPADLHKAVASNQAAFDRAKNNLAGRRDNNGNAIGAGADRLIENKNGKVLKDVASSLALKEAIRSKRDLDLAQLNLKNIKQTQETLTASQKESQRRSDAIKAQLQERKDAIRQGAISAGAGVGGVLGGLAGFQVGTAIANAMSKDTPSWVKVGVSIGTAVIGQGLGSAIGSGIVTTFMLSASFIGKKIADGYGMIPSFVKGALVVGAALYAGYLLFKYMPDEWSAAIKKSFSELNFFQQAGLVLTPIFLAGYKLFKFLPETWREKISSVFTSSIERGLSSIGGFISAGFRSVGLSNVFVVGAILLGAALYAGYKIFENLPEKWRDSIKSAVGVRTSKEEATRDKFVGKTAEVFKENPMGSEERDKALTKLANSMNDKLGGARPLEVSEIADQLGLTLVERLKLNSELERKTVEAREAAGAKERQEVLKFLQELPGKIAEAIFKKVGEAASDSLQQNIPMMATGGRVSGPGTGTSDSIAAWLSNGEFVVNAKGAAEHRGLLDAINSGKELPRFNAGTPPSSQTVTVTPKDNEVKVKIETIGDVVKDGINQARQKVEDFKNTEWGKSFIDLITTANNALTGKPENPVLPSTQEVIDKKSLNYKLDSAKTMEATVSALSEGIEKAGFSKLDTKALGGLDAATLKNIGDLTDRVLKLNQQAVNPKVGALGQKLAQATSDQLAGEIRNILDKSQVANEAPAAAVAADEKAKKTTKVKLGDQGNIIGRGFPELGLDDKEILRLSDEIRNEVFNAAFKAVQSIDKLDNIEIGTMEGGIESIPGDVQKKKQAIEDQRKVDLANIQTKLEGLRTPFAPLKPVLDDIGENLSKDTFNLFDETSKQAIAGLAKSIQKGQETLLRPDIVGDVRVTIQDQLDETRKLLQKTIGESLAKSLTGFDQLKTVLDQLGISIDERTYNLLTAIDKEIINGAIAQIKQNPVSGGQSEDARAALQRQIDKSQATINKTLGDKTKDSKIKLAGEAFASAFDESITSALSGFLSGQQSFKKTFKSVVNQFSQSIVDTTIKGFMDPFVGEDGIINKIMRPLGEDIFNKGREGSGKGRVEGTSGSTMEQSSWSGITNTFAVAVDSFTRAVGLGTATPEGVSASNPMGLTPIGADYGLNGFGKKLGTKDVIETQKQGSNEITQTVEKSNDGLGTTFKGSLANVDKSLLQGFSGVTGMLSLIAAGSGGGGKMNWLGVVAGGLSLAAGLAGSKHADGGAIRGPGTGTSDSIRAWLSNGEFVVNAKSTKAWLPMLEAINSDAMPKFAEGGQITNATLQQPSMASLVATERPSQTSNTANVNININGDVSRQTRATIYEMLPNIAAGVNAHNKESGEK